MPVTLANLDNGLGVLFACTGIVSGGEFIEVNSRVTASAKERKMPTRYCIIDYSKADKVMLTSSDIEVITSQDKTLAKYFPDFIVAIVAVKDFEYGISRMWETFIELHDLLWETMVFKGKGDAEAWIKQRMKEKFDQDVSVVREQTARPV